MLSPLSCLAQTRCSGDCPLCEPVSPFPSSAQHLLLPLEPAVGLPEQPAELCSSSRLVYTSEGSNPPREPGVGETPGLGTRKHKHL